MKKNKWYKVIMMLIAIMVPLSSIQLSTLAYANSNKINVEFNEELDGENKASINMTIEKDDKYQITSVLLPNDETYKAEDMSIAENGNMSLTYGISENKSYNFKVNFIDLSEVNESGKAVEESEIHSFTSTVVADKKQNEENVSNTVINTESQIALMAEGEDYKQGTASINQVILKQDSTNPNYTITSNKNMGFKVGVQTKSIGSGEQATKIWLGYRFVINEKSVSGGSWSFEDTSYTWLRDKDDSSKVATPKTDGNGNIVLEGVYLHSRDGNNVIGDILEKPIIVVNKDGVTGDVADFRLESWIVSDGDTSKVTATPVKINVTSTPEFDSSFSSNAEVALSGYYNQSTGEFQIKKPSNMAGFQYGRFVVSSQILMSTLNGNEKLDPTKPVNYKVSASVMVGEKDAQSRPINEKEETDTNFKPIIVGYHSGANTDMGNEMGSSKLTDLTLGGLVDQSYYLQRFSYQTIKADPAKYNYQMDGQTSVTVHATPSINDKNSGYNNVGTSVLIFVPTNENDKENVTRRIKLDISEVSATSYSGQGITEINGNNNTQYGDIPRVPGEGESLAGTFSREIGVRLQDASITTLANGEKSYIGGRVSSLSQSQLIDFNINAVNVLVKFQSGYLIDQEYDANTSAYTGKVKTLYAVKADGTGWKDEQELNHTTDSELRYYDKLADAKNAGELVGVLFEYRGGIWKSYNLEYRMPFTAKGKGLNVVVQDVKMWRGSNELTTNDTYAGTNGSALPKIAKSTDFMVPYDNPNNTTGIYQKDSFDQLTGTITQNEGHVWGDTLYIVPVNINVLNNYKSDDSNFLNGTNIISKHGAWNNIWANATYDIGKNERISDRRVVFTVQGTSDERVHLKISLDGKNYMSDDVIEQFGEVRLGTPTNPVKYTPNSNPALTGTYSGGEVIDPNNFSVLGDGTYTVYYTSKIGDISDLSKEAKVGVSWNETTLLIQDKSKEEATINQATVAMSTTITKSTLKGAQKDAISSSSVNEAGYRLSMDSNNEAIKNNYLLDVLPFNNDGRGSNFNGDYTLKDDKVVVKKSTTDGSSATTKEVVYYTTDEAVRTAGKNGEYLKSDVFQDTAHKNNVVDFNATEIVINGITFKVATKNSDGSWSVPSGSKVTAVLMCSDIGMNERLSLEIRLSLHGHKKGDVYINASSSAIDGYAATDSGKASSTVPSRNISGTAWIDQGTSDNLFNSAIDKKYAGVSVKLFKKDGTQITVDENGDAYGDVKTDSNGKYTFNCVPYNADGYYVEFEEATFNKKLALKQYVKGATSPVENIDDSDTVGVYTNEVLQKTKSDVFTLHTDDYLVSNNLINENVQVDTGYRDVISSFELTVVKDYIKISKGTTFDKIKEMIGAEAKIIVDGKETDLSHLIDWSGLNGFDTSIYGNKITFKIKVENPITKTIEEKELTIEVAKAVVITGSDVDLVVNDSFDPLQGVKITDGDGNNVSLKDTAVKVDTSALDLTKPGNYDVIYEYTDAYGHKGSYTRKVRVHGELQFEKNERVDLLQKNGTIYTPNTVQAFYINSDGNRVNVTGGAYRDTVDQSIIRKNTITYDATHPINNSKGSITQDIYVHGNVILTVPADKKALVGTQMNPYDGVKAVYKHVEDDGTIVEKDAVLSTTTSNPFTSNIPTTVIVSINAKAEFNGLISEANDTYNVNFGILPIITTDTDRIEVKVGTTLDEMKALFNAKAMVHYAGDSNDTDLTASIDYKELAAINTSIENKTYKIKLYVTDKEGNKAEKEVEVYVSSKIAVTLPTVNKVVGEKFDPTDGVTIVDGYGQVVDMKDVTIDTSKVDMTKVGNYDVTYTYKDAIGNEINVVNTIHVHGKLEIEGLDRIDLERKDGATFVPNTGKAFYINSDGKKVYVDGEYDKTINQAKVGLTETIFSATHPINKEKASGTQKVYVHGEIVFEKEEIKIHKVGEKVNSNQYAKASFEKVNDDGTISRVDLSVNGTELTSDKPAYVNGKVDASIKINGLVIKGNDTLTVGFEGYPYINSVGHISVDEKTKTIEELKEMIKAAAGMTKADGSTKDLTDQIVFEGLDKVNPDKAGNYKVVLTVKDEQGNITTKVVTITVNKKVIIVPTPGNSQSVPAKPVVQTPDRVTEVEEENSYVVITKDIPLSETEKGISNDLIKKYITATNELNEKADFEIISHDVIAKVGTYEVTIRFADGIEKTVKINVVDDSSKDVQKPEYGQDENCIIHWIILLLLLGYSIYAITTMMKRRHDIKELEDENVNPDTNIHNEKKPFEGGK